MLDKDQLGQALYNELHEPDTIDLYLVGVTDYSDEDGSEYQNENESDLEYLVDALEQETEVTAHRIADESYDRDDVEQIDIFEHEFPDDSLLLVPDTYTFGRGGPSAHDRYREFIDRIPETGLKGILHLNVEDDLEHAPERMDDEYPVGDLIDDLAHSYRKTEGRVYDGKVIEAEDMETVLFSRLY